MFRMAHHRSARLDLLYMNAESGQNPMDLLTDAGFVILGEICVCYNLLFFWVERKKWISWIYTESIPMFYMIF